MFRQPGTRLLPAKLLLNTKRSGDRAATAAKNAVSVAAATIIMPGMVSAVARRLLPRQRAALQNLQGRALKPSRKLARTRRNRSGSVTIGATSTNAMAATAGPKGKSGPGILAVEASRDIAPTTEMKATAVTTQDAAPGRDATVIATGVMIGADGRPRSSRPHRPSGEAWIPTAHSQRWPRSRHPWTSAGKDKDRAAYAPARR